MITQVINGINNTNYSVNQVAKLNSISNPNLIKVGQQIVPNMAFLPDISNSLRSTTQSTSSEVVTHNALFTVILYVLAVLYLLPLC